MSVSQNTICWDTLIMAHHVVAKFVAHRSFKGRSSCSAARSAQVLSCRDHVFARLRDSGALSNVPRIRIWIRLLYGLHRRLMRERLDRHSTSLSTLGDLALILHLLRRLVLVGQQRLLALFFRRLYTCLFLYLRALFCHSLGSNFRCFTSWKCVKC